MGHRARTKGEIGKGAGLSGDVLCHQARLMKIFWLFFAMIWVTSGLSRAEDIGEALRADAVELIAAMSESQRERAVFPLGHENRWQMRFTGGQRPGVSLEFLAPPAREVIDRMMGRVLSKRGMQKAAEVAAQDGADLGRLSLAIFGDPSSEGEFIWRVGEHHFTVVSVVIAGGELKEFGPILLGSNPYGPWDHEEKAFLKVWEAAGGAIPLEKSKGIATAPKKKGVGLPIGQLNDEAKEALAMAIDERLALFQPAIIAQLKDVISRSGEVRIAFYNEQPTKIGRFGGRWDVKIGNDKMAFDLELSRGHNHMSIWMRGLDK